MRPRHLIVAFLLTVCTAAAPSARQAPPGAGVVHLDVTAVDPAGRPVRDLGVADFEVVADGQPARIESVTIVELPVEVAPVVRGRIAPAQVAHDLVRNDDAIGRYLAIVLDDIVEPGAAADSWVTTAGLDLARALIERLGPDDRATVFFSFMGRQQGLTSDRERLSAVLDRFTRRTVTAGDCPGGSGADGCLVDTLQRVAEALPAASRRRKTVVVISDRAVAPVADASAAERTIDALHATNATVYTIAPPAGAGTPGASGPASMFVDATGGRVLVDGGGTAPVDAVWTEAGNYYLLTVSGIRDTTRGPVAVRVTRPDVTVRARKGHASARDALPSSEAASPLEQAMISPHQVASLPLGTTAAVFAVPGRREAVVVISTALTAAPAPSAAGWLADVAATAFDGQWRPRASHRQTIEVTGGPGPRTVDVLSAIELLPGQYELRVGAESGGRAGSVFLDVDVAEFLTAPLSASGVVVTTAPVPYSASPLLAGTLPVTPTARRLFLRSESAEVFVRFYQGNRGRIRALPVSLRIADASGEATIQGDETIPPGQFDDARSTEWRFVLPLERLPAGEYLLTVEATLDDRRVTRHLRFSVMR